MLEYRIWMVEPRYAHVVRIPISKQEFTNIHIESEYIQSSAAQQPRALGS